VAICRSRALITNFFWNESKFKNNLAAARLIFDITISWLDKIKCILLFQQKLDFQMIIVDERKRLSACR
jgi:hypothetical protein